MKKTINIIYFIIVCFIVIFGIFLRASFYKTGMPLWVDEIALALSVLKHNFLFSFGLLEVAQKCPPILLLMTFLNKYLFGISVYSLRLVPFISGILSVIAFWWVSKIYFKNKISQLSALLLFALCAPLIYYSQEFKQYSTDVFICILLMISYKYIDILNANKKQLFLYSLSALLLPLISFPSLFIIPAICIMKFTECKSAFKKFIPVISGYIVSAIYLIILYNELRGREIQIELWQEGFIGFSVNKIALIITNFFGFTDINTIIGTLFAFAGIVIILREKQKQWLYLLLIIAFATIASYLKIYPLYERTILYLIPIAIMLMIKPVDFLLSAENKIKKLFGVFLSIIFIAAFFCSYTKVHNPLNIYSYCYNKNCELRIEEEQIYKKFLEKYKPDENIITFISIFDMDYYGIINGYKYNIYEKFIPARTTAEAFEENIKAQNDLSDYYWVVLDKILIKNKDDFENYLRENNIKYELFAESGELKIYYIEKTK